LLVQTVSSDNNEGVFCEAFVWILLNPEII